MSKKFKIVYSIIFFALCTLPLILMPFFKNDPSIEKREFAKLPAYYENGSLNLDFGTGFEAWYNDRVPFRANLLAAANFIKGETLHAETSNVMIGKDGWLFYANEAADYMNTNALSENQVKATAVTLGLIQENVESRGGKFTFVAMPNKSSVYPEMVGGNYQQASENNLTRINDALDEAGVNHVDMKAVLTDAKMELAASSYRDPADKDGPTLYHRRDSHWNYMGALVGYDAIMTSLDKKHESYSDKVFSEYSLRYDWRADLDKLVYPAWGTMDKQYYYDVDHAEYKFSDPKGVRDQEAQLELFMSDKEQGDDLFTIRNMELDDGSKLYMARDSFGRALLPYIKDNYEYSTYKRTDCPDIANLEDGTDLVYEIGERNLYKVIAKAPFMYAPKRSEKDVTAIIDLVGKVKSYYKQEGYGTKIYGAFPEGIDMGDGRVLIQLSGGGKTYIYEAFPIYENSLMGAGDASAADGDDEESLNFGTDGFSATLKKDALPAGEFELTVITGGAKYTGEKIVIE